MNIAVVGWGSLISCPGSVRIKTRWRLDGPRLPIEFARISRDGRLTLVIHPDSEDQPTYWAVSEFTTLGKARRNVSERENAKLADIHYLVRNGEAGQRIPPQIMERVKDWLVMHEDLQAVVWTGLRSNWEEKRGRDFSPEDAVNYLRELEAGSDQAPTIYNRAREYVRNTPPYIQTAVRRAMHAQGWEDVELPTILFESQPSLAVTGYGSMKEPTQICRGFTDEQWKVLRERLIRPDRDITNDEAAWSCAVDVFARRIRERFLSCIEALEKADSQSDIEIPPRAPPDCSTLPNDDGRQIVVPGFAIMALCSLLIETLQSFREAPESHTAVKWPCSYPDGPCIRPPSSTTELFKDFLRLPAFRGAFDDDTIATRFVRGIRNGILHEAETRGWVIWRDEPDGRILESRNDGYALNRTEFYIALKSEFEKYLQELRNPANQELRQRFLKKMNDVVKKC